MNSSHTLFDHIAHWAAERPSQVALIDGSTGDRVYYSDLLPRVDRLAGALARHGIRRDSHCVILMQRNNALVELMLAVSRCGAYCLPFVGHNVPRQSFDDARERLAPDLFVFDPAIHDAAAWRQAGERWIDMPTLLDSDVDPLAYNYVPVPDDSLYLNTSSGSTGMAKMLVATHHAVIENTIACQAGFGFGPGDVHLSTFRLHQHDLFARALITGGATVLLPTAEDPVRLVDALAAFEVNYLMTNPTTFALMYEIRKQIPRLGLGRHLRLIECGGGFISSTARRSISSTTGSRVVSVWGSTETAGVALAPFSANQHRDGVGTGLPGYTVTIVTSDGNPVEDGQEGELVIEGNGVARKYFGTVPDEQQVRLAGGVFRTGDIAQRAADGSIEIRGRVDNLFKVGSAWVGAEPIECGIRESVDVADVAVVPRSHPVLGHAPIALVVLRDGQQKLKVRTGKLARHLRDPLLELPHWFVLVDEIPKKTPGGKVDRIACKKLIPANLTATRRRRLKVLKNLMRVVRSLGEPRLILSAIPHPIKYWPILRVIVTDVRGRIHDARTRSPKPAAEPAVPIPICAPGDLS